MTFKKPLLQDISDIREVIEFSVNIQKILVNLYRYVLKVVTLHSRFHNDLIKLIQRYESNQSDLTDLKVISTIIFDPLTK